MNHAPHIFVTVINCFKQNIETKLKVVIYNHDYLNTPYASKWPNEGKHLSCLAKKTVAFLT